MKKIVAVLLTICLFMSMVLPGAVWADTGTGLTEIYFDINNITLSGPTSTPFFTADYGTDGINDGKYELPSLAQIEYHGVPYGADGKLTESFYVDIDLKAIYDLDQLSITWYTTRGTRYLVYGSKDGSRYTQIADQSDTANLTTLTESAFAPNTRARYVRIEVLGMANNSGLTGNNYFSFHEIDLYGTLAENQDVPTEITYDIDCVKLSAPGTASNVTPWFDNNYDITGLNDGKYALPSLVQIIYVGVPYGSDGKLIESFYIDIDLGKSYNLDTLSITWYTTRGVRYLVHSSKDGNHYTQIADHADTVDGTMFVESTFAANVSGRYVRIEILGMDRHNDGLNGEKNYFSLHELDIFGTETSVHEIAYDVNNLKLSAPGTTSTIVPWFFEAPAGTTDGSYDINCLNDGKYVSPSFAQIVYAGVPYGSDGNLIESFNIDVDLGAFYELNQLSITWLSDRGVRYLIHGSQNGRNYTQIGDHSNTADLTTYTEDTFESGVRVRYVRIEILGMNRYADILDGSKNYFVLHELDVFGSLSDNQMIDETSIISIAPELTEAITLHYTAYIREEDANNVRMMFVFGNEEFWVDGIAGENRLYTFSFTDILPQQMTMNIAAYLYTDGVLQDSVNSYSLQTYCVNTLSRTTEEDQALRTLLVAMLQYGATAEEYFTGVADGISDDILDETALSYLTNYDMSQASGVVTKPVQGTKDENYTWKAATLGCYDMLKIRLKFTATNIEETRIQVLGKVYTYADFVNAGNGNYYIYTDGIPVRDFATEITAVFLDTNGNPVGESVIYSVNTYIAYIASSGTSEVFDLVQAIYNYGCAAKAYVKTQGSVQE